MDTVSVSELKARLSHYLRRVKRGGEVVVLDRGVPAARLIGVGPAGDDAQRLKRDRLAKAGILRLGAGDASWIVGTEPIVVQGPTLSEALADDRRDRV